MYLFFISFFSPLIAQQNDAFEEKQSAFFKEAQKIYPNLKNYKSPHFLINYSTPTVEKYPAIMESFFQFFKTVMSVQPGEAFFNSRVEVYFWEKRSDFRSFAKQFDDMDATFSGAYF